jgi:hypothetical protein
MLHVLSELWLKVTHTTILYINSISPLGRKIELMHNNLNHSVYNIVINSFGQKNNNIIKNTLNFIVFL